MTNKKVKCKIGKKMSLLCSHCSNSSPKEVKCIKPTAADAKRTLILESVMQDTFTAKTKVEKKEKHE